MMRPSNIFIKIVIRIGAIIAAIIVGGAILEIINVNRSTPEDEVIIRRETLELFQESLAGAKLHGFNFGMLTDNK